MMKSTDAATFTLIWTAVHALYCCTSIACAHTHPYVKICMYIHIHTSHH